MLIFQRNVLCEKGKMVSICEPLGGPRFVINKGRETNKLLFQITKDY